MAKTILITFNKPASEISSRNVRYGKYLVGNHLIGWPDVVGWLREVRIPVQVANADWSWVSRKSQLMAYVPRYRKAAKRDYSSPTKVQS